MRKCKCTNKTELHCRNMGLAGSECRYMVSLAYKVHAVNALLVLTAAMVVILSSLFSFV